MIPALIAAVGFAAASPPPGSVTATPAESVGVVAPWRPPPVPRRPGERRRVDVVSDSLGWQWVAPELAPDLRLDDAWRLRERLRESHEQRVHAAGEIHESRGLLAVPTGVLPGTRDGSGSPGPARYAWADIDSIELRSLGPSPMNGLGDVVGYLGILPVGGAGAIAAALEDGDQAAKEKASSEAAGAALGILIGGTITADAVGELLLRRPGAWTTVYRRPALRRVETGRSGLRDSVWRLLLATEGQRRLRFTLADGAYEVNRVSPTADGLRLAEFHRRGRDPARDIRLDDIRRLEILRAPAMGGPRPRPGRNVSGSVLALGMVAGAALTADDGYEFGQNLIGSAIVGTAAIVGLALLWLAPYHLLSRWEAFDVAP